MIEFKNIDLGWIIEKINRRENFAMGSYGDGEFNSMFTECLGSTNAIGEVYTAQLRDHLRSTFAPLPNFYYGTDENLIKHEGTRKNIQSLLKIYNRESIDFVDGVVFDRTVRLGDLRPLIDSLRFKSVYLIGNKNHQKLARRLNIDFVIEIPENNCGPEVMRYADNTPEIKSFEDVIFFISAGLWGSWLAYRLFQRFPNQTFIDVGSMWDVFLGTGAQRGWRQELYADPIKHKAHCFDNIYGKDWFGPLKV